MLLSVVRESLREESNQFAQMLESSENGNLYCNDEGKDMESVPHMILAGEKGEIFATRPIIRNIKH